MWFIIRHGETLYNVKNIIQGHYDSMLTLKGINQIKSIAYRILDAKEDFNSYKLVVSPMVRAKHTMQIIQEILNITNIHYTEESLLSEIDTGIATNMPENEAKIKFPFLWDVREYLKKQYPKGESTNEVYDRVLKFYEKYKNEDNLIIISHYGVIKCLRNILLKRKREDIDNVALNQNYFYLWKQNHLEKL